MITEFIFSSIKQIVSCEGNGGNGLIADSGFLSLVASLRLGSKWALHAKTSRAEVQGDENPLPIPAAGSLLVWLCVFFFSIIIIIMFFF